MPNLQSGLVMTLQRNLTNSAADVSVYVDTLPSITIPSEGVIALIDSPGEVNSTDPTGPEYVKITAKSSSPNYLTVVRGIDTTTSFTPTQDTSLIKPHNAGDTKIFLINHHTQYAHSWSGPPTINASLPTAGNTTNEFRFVTDETVFKYWDGAAWQDVTAPVAAADASTTVKGITKMSVAPASATSPIAVGDNDPRVVSKLSLTQTETTGATLALSRDLASASTDSPVLTIVQDNAGDDQAGLTIQQDGTGDGFTVTGNSTGTVGNIIAAALLGASEYGLRIYSNFEQTNSPLLYVQTDVATSTADLANFVNDGTGNGIYINQTTALAATKYALHVYSNVAQTNTPLLRVHSDNATSSVLVAQIVNDGLIDGLEISQTNTAATGEALSITRDSGNELAELLRDRTNANGTFYFYRNLASTATAGPVFKIVQDITTDDQNVLEIQQDGAAGNGVNISMTNTAGTGNGFTATRDSGTELADILRDRADAGGTFRFYRNLAAANTAGPVFNIINDNATDDQDALTVQQDAPADGIFIDYNDTSATAYALNIDTEQANDSAVINIDLPAASNAFQVRHNTDVTNDVVLKLGAARVWTDTNGDMRFQTSAPTSDTGGSIISGKYHVGTNSRAGGAGSGDQAITGVGFTPRLIEIHAVASSGAAFAHSEGAATSASDEQVAYVNAAGAGNVETGNIISVINAGNSQKAVLKSNDSDGFTLTWTEAGAANVAVGYVYRCYA